MEVELSPFRYCGVVVVEVFAAASGRRVGAKMHSVVAPRLFGTVDLKNISGCSHGSPGGRDSCLSNNLQHRSAKRYSVLFTSVIAYAAMAFGSRTAIVAASCSVLIGYRCKCWKGVVVYGL